MKTMKSKARESWAAAKARQVLKDIGLDSLIGIEIEDVAFLRQVLVTEGPIDGGDAWLVRQEAGGIIRVNSHLSAARRRFAIAHELGHWELHPDQTQAHVFTEQTAIKEYKASSLEREANAFASELLMPKSVFRRDCDIEKVCWHEVSRLASKYETSLYAASRKFVECTAEECALVVSVDGRMRYIYRSVDCSLRVPLGRALSSQTYAADLTAGKDSHVEIQEVSATSWNPDADSNEIYIESSIALFSFGTVLSLLWKPLQE